MAAYLKALPQQQPEPVAEVRAAASVTERGARLYGDHCLQCHGAQGQGVPSAYPPLAGNRAVTLSTTANLVQVVLAGGYPPATAGNPRPFGMPPYATVLSDAEVAAVLSFIRSSWGNKAAPVSELAVARHRGG
jgi:mono/diheme cytochrome c family protein